jgi:hypothetical protein
MDFASVWARASAAASEVATAAQEQASKAAAAAQEQAEALQRTEAFAQVSATFGEIRANTVAVAERGERNLRTMMENDDEKRLAAELRSATPEAYGVDADFRAFLAALAPETLDAVPPAALDAQTPVAASPWRETHARLALAAAPELASLRSALVPKSMTDDRFWAAYFAHTSSRLRAFEEAARELEDAEARREELRRKERALEADRRGGDAEPSQVELVPLSVGPAEAAAALAAEYADLDVSSDETDAEDETDANAGGGANRSRDAAEGEEAPPSGTSGRGDLEAYLEDMLAGGSTDEEEEEEEEVAGLRDDIEGLLGGESDDGDADAGLEEEDGAARGEGPKTWEKVEPPPNV